MSMKALPTASISLRARAQATLARDGGINLLSGNRSFVGATQLGVMPARQATIKASQGTYTGLVPDVKVKHPSLGEMPARPGRVEYNSGLLRLSRPGMVPDFETYPTTRTVDGPNGSKVTEHLERVTHQSGLLTISDWGWVPEKVPFPLTRFSVSPDGTTVQERFARLVYSSGLFDVSRPGYVPMGLVGDLSN